MIKYSMVRIAHVVGKWLGGGVEAVVMNYYRHIDRSKFQFDFICDADSTCIPRDEIEKLGGRIFIVPPYQNLFSYISELKKIFHGEDYKIVHSHLNTLSVFPLYAAKKAEVPIRIAHSHSTSNKKEWKKNILKNILKPFSKMYATDYFCCSEVAGRYLFGNKCYNTGKVILLKNAIELYQFRYNEQLRNAKRLELGLSENTFIVGHVGRFVTQKNHVFLIDIFNEIQKIHTDSILLLAGQGPLFSRIQDKVRDLNLMDKVKFLGQRNDVSALYQAFDTVVLPSLYEGLVVVLVEAQCSGLQCFCSTDVSPETKISPNLTYFSLNETPAEWARKICQMHENYKRTNNTESIVENGYDINIEARKLEVIYLNMIEGKK